MTISKKILILANSVKRKGRCVAGREVLNTDPLRLGNWIRPVSNEKGGTLFYQHMQTKGREQVSLLDIFEIPLLEPMPEAGQPENWSINLKQPWVHLGSLVANKQLAQAITEEPSGIWNAGYGHSDRIVGNHPTVEDSGSSLVIVKPESGEFVLQRLGPDPWHNYSRKRALLKLLYREDTYWLNVTDDDYANKNFAKSFPEEASSDSRKIPLKGNELVCVSLTPIFNGNHYKVAATILSIP